MTHMRAGTASALITFADVEAFTAKLKVISDWRDELQSKLDRATLRFELCGLDPEQEQRTEEVSAFVSLITGRRPSCRRRANPPAKHRSLTS
jgi:hypothetical protein